MKNADNSAMALNKKSIKEHRAIMICTLFTGQPVRRAFLCVIVMSLN